ncbi:MAG: hypothetical protein Q8L56_09365 [Rhodocyclaceae bacterium]|nr:hypothetical protein [Rhodocyclaceae bacterium]
MARQINLYDPALLRKRDWFALSNVVLAAAALATCVVVAGVLAQRDLPTLKAQTTTNDTQLKALREQVLVLGRRVAERKPDPRVETELAAARLLAGMRGEVLQTLRQRLEHGTDPFADYLRGFARQSVTGLWLTAFAYDAASGSMEIHGRTVDPALLPEYIQRLNREPAFRGRAFASLRLAEGKLEPVAGTPAKAGAPAEAVKPAPFHEFTLIPVKEGAAQAPGTQTPERRG